METITAKKIDMRFDECYISSSLYIYRGELSFLQPVHFCICWRNTAILSSYLFQQWLACMCVSNWKMSWAQANSTYTVAYILPIGSGEYEEVELHRQTPIKDGKENYKPYVCVACDIFLMFRSKMTIAVSKLCDCHDILAMKDWNKVEQSLCHHYIVTDLPIVLNHMSEIYYKQ